MARRKDPLIWGLILIALGVIFFLENYHIDAWEYVWRLWPLVLILWGAGKLVTGLQERREKSRPQAPAGSAGQDRP